MGDPASSSMRAPALTVLIPALGRWALLAAQVRSLEGLLAEAEAAFEIVIHDNSFAPAPAGLVEGLPSSVRYIRSSETFDTAEETLCAAFHLCRGEYVWLLADDDGVEAAGLRELLRIIEGGGDDLIVFNRRPGRDDRFEGDGADMAQGAWPVFYEKQARQPVGTFVARTGFFCGLCTISTVVVRRSAAPVAPLERYFSISRTHAYLAWLIEIGKDKRFVFVSRPLVVSSLRHTDPDGACRERRAGLQEGGYSNAVRTGLWLRVLDELIARGALTRDQVRRTTEINCATRSHFGSTLAQQILEQVGEMAEAMPSEDLNLAVRWLAELLPSSIHLNALVAEISEFSTEHGASLMRIEDDSRFDQATRAIARDLRDRAAWWRQALAGSPWYARYHVETLHLYEIYDFGDDWVAAHLGFSGLSEALQVIDLPSLPPVFLRAPTYDALRGLVQAQPFTPEGFKTVRLAAPALPVEPGRPAGSETKSTTGEQTCVATFDPRSQHEEAARLRAELGRQDDQLAEVYASASWRFTGWMRRLASVLRPLRVRSGYEAAPTLELGKRLDLGRADADAFMPRGFSGPEGWGRWTDGHTAIFRCRHVARDVAGVLEVWPSMLWDRGAPGGFTVRVRLNDEGEIPIDVRSGERFLVPVPARTMAGPQLEIAFHVAAPKARDEPPIDDLRGLGMGLSELRLSFVDDPPKDSA